MLQETIDVLSARRRGRSCSFRTAAPTTRTRSRGFADRCRLIAYPDRRGKGAALRIGLAAARGEYVAFIDADGDIEPEAFTAFLRLVDLYEPDAVVGSKRHPLSHVDYPPIRRLLSWVFHLMTRTLFRLNVRDTQTGMKLFRRDVLADVLPRVRDDGYTFDLELLVAAARRGYRRIFEAPIRVGYRSASHIGFGTPFRMATSTSRCSSAATSSTRTEALRSGAETERRCRVSDPLGDDGVATGSPLRILILNWRDVANPRGRRRAVHPRGREALGLVGPPRHAHHVTVPWRSSRRDDRRGRDPTRRRAPPRIAPPSRPAGALPGARLRRRDRRDRHDPVPHAGLERIAAADRRDGPSARRRRLGRRDAEAAGGDRPPDGTAPAADVPRRAGSTISGSTSISGASGCGTFG